MEFIQRPYKELTGFLVCYLLCVVFLRLAN
jgi:hypothetical protein